jgi:hypothetical protein
MQSDVNSDPIFPPNSDEGYKAHSLGQENNIMDARGETMNGMGVLVVVFCFCASALFSQSQNLTANQIHVTSLQFFDAGYNPPEYGRRFFQPSF